MATDNLDAIAADHARDDCTRCLHHGIARCEDRDWDEQCGCVVGDLMAGETEKVEVSSA